MADGVQDFALQYFVEFNLAIALKSDGLKYNTVQLRVIGVDNWYLKTR